MIEEALSKVSPEKQPILFFELLEIELWWRRVRGERLSLPEFEKRFPLFRQQIALAFERLPTVATTAVDLVEGPLRGAAFEFPINAVVTWGRSLSCDIAIPDDPLLSKEHCRILGSPGEVRIRDGGSRNGTLINGKRITDSVVHDDDIVTAGSSQARVRRLRHVPQHPVEAGPTVIGGPGDAIDQRTSRLPQISGYENLSELGRGGLGVVYLARQASSGRPVAIKCIRPDQSAGPEMIRLFLREASVLSQLQHRQIVQFIELGLADEQMYLAMEYVPTVSFQNATSELSAERRIEVACGLICRVLDALEFAHAKGFVHRDVKPANLLIYRSGKKLDVKLADFGLAKNFQNAGFSGLTGDNTTRGSLAFMSPEQVRNSRDAGPSTDLYALGVTLYHYVTGRLPFDFAIRGNEIRTILERAPDFSSKPRQRNASRPCYGARQSSGKISVSQVRLGRGNAGGHLPLHQPK